MNRYDAGAIEYTETEKIREALVGRTIWSTISEGGEYDRVVSFVLDDGSILKAHATDGGCGCSNGCFTVDSPYPIKGTITNVEVREQAESWSESARHDVEPGSVSDGQALIRVFVYTELGEQLLVESEGGDNGYYGWGFWLSVHRPERPTGQEERAA